MKIRIQYMFVVILSVLLQSCSNRNLEAKDFVGVWKSDDGAVIELNKDFSFTAKQINISNIFFKKDIKSERINLVGKWEFTIDMNNNQVIKIDSNKHTFDFYISGQGAFGNKPPFNLYVFIGDPDEMIKYKFVKQ